MKYKNYIIACKLFVILVICVSAIMVSFNLLKLDFFKTSGNSMNDTLIDGDLILVKKNIQIKLERRDIIILSKQNQYFVKRCIALPGDTIRITKDQILLNNKYEDIILQKSSYKIFYNDSVKLVNCINNLKEFYFNTQENPVNLITYLTKSQVNKLRSKEFIDSVVFHLINNSSGLKVYPWDNHISWSIDNFGPYVIPKKLQKINLNGKNYFIYNKLIREYEFNISCNLEESYVQGIKYFNFYKFKKNYYFIIGDNLQKSNDSRFWGPIPEENIIGIAVLVLFNYHNGKFRWDRFLKKIE